MKIPENSAPFGLALQPRASTRTNTAGRAREMSPQEKNLRALNSSLRTQFSPKQQAAGKVGWLRHRLEMMKAMLQFATPAQAKHLLRELKGIAKELASVARSLNTMDGGTLSGTVTFSVDAVRPGDTADAAAPDAARAAEQAQAAAGEAAEAAAEARTAQSETVAAAAATETTMVDETDEADEADGPGEGHGTAAASGATASDRGLRQALVETARLVREILDRLKAMLTDKDNRKVAAETEKILVELNRELSRGADAGFYSAQGAPVSVAEPTFAGVDVSA
jgi:hypothetical protein